jgi:carbohydrate-selective porin OprB
MATTSSTFRPTGKQENQGNKPTGNTGQQNNAGQQGADTFDKAKEVGTQVMDKAREAASSVTEMAGGTATNFGKKADDYAATAGADIRHWGDELAQKGPRDGMLGQASQCVADTLKESGRYLEQHKLSGVAGDVSQLIRSHPVPALLICLGIGFCIGRALKT